MNNNFEPKSAICPLLIVPIFDSAQVNVVDWAVTQNQTFSREQSNTPNTQAGPGIVSTLSCVPTLPNQTYKFLYQNFS